MLNNIIFSNITDIINTDAITIKDHYFFATHKPFDNIKFSKSGSDTGNEFDVTEEELFNDHIQDILKDHSFTIIKGDNGTGKSHFIKWLNFKLEKDLDGREIVFIKRHQATLKSTIRQLGDLEVVKNNNELNKKVEEFLKGKKTTDIDKLKDLLISHIATEIEHDDDDFFNRGHRNQIYGFLHNKFIKEQLLKKENGFIDRICKRLVGESEFRLDDVPVEISKDDLKIDLDFLSDMKRENPDDLNRNVERIARKLEKKGKFLDDLVKYIDSVIDAAIQITVDFNADNMMDLLSEIRRAIKDEDKKLVLLIEDITAFPGLEKALREALILDHKKDDTLCQVNSFVGVTTAYYSKHFIENEKDRVTEKIIINSDSIFSTNEDKFDFVSRYLNAMLLPENVILNWFNNGMIIDDLPEYYELNKEKFPKWSVYKDQLLLFPFNETAIIRLYNSLKEYERTPRIFLKEIIKPMIIAFDSNPTSFPPPLEILLKNNIKIENWSDSHMNEVAKQLLKDEEKFESFNTFLLLYSNRSISVEEIDGEKKYVGLSKETFNSFDFDIKYSAFTESNKKIQKKQEKVKNTEVKTLNKKNQEIKNLKSLINNWYTNNKEYNFRKIREQLINIIPSLIDYKRITITKNQLEEQLTLGTLYFESKSSKWEEQIIIQRLPETQYMMEAIANYIYLGDKSWNYDTANIDFNILINYIEERIYPQIENKFENKKNNSIEKILAFNILEIYLSNPNILEKPIYELYLDLISIEEYKNIGKIYSLDKKEELEKFEFTKDKLLIALEDYCKLVGNVKIINSSNIVIDIIEIFEIIEDLVSNFKERNIEYIDPILTFLDKYNLEISNKIEMFLAYTKGMNSFDEIVKFYDSLSEHKKAYDSREKNYFKELEKLNLYNKITKEITNYDFKGSSVLNYNQMIRLNSYDFDKIIDSLRIVNRFLDDLCEEINVNIKSIEVDNSNFEEKLLEKIDDDMRSIEKVIKYDQ